MVSTPFRSSCTAASRCSADRPDAQDYSDAALRVSAAFATWTCGSTRTVSGWMRSSVSCSQSTASRSASPSTATGVANDRHRRFANGRSSYEQVVRAIELLRAEPVPASVRGPAVHDRRRQRSASGIRRINSAGAAPDRLPAAPCDLGQSARTDAGHESQYADWLIADLPPLAGGWASRRHPDLRINPVHPGRRGQPDRGAWARAVQPRGYRDRRQL